MFFVSIIDASALTIRLNTLVFNVRKLVGNFDIVW